MMRQFSPFLLVWLAAAPGWAEEQPSFALTTDTLQYCNQLVRQISDRHSTLPDVVRLLGEGRGMCDKGEIRGGIRRLRRALVVLHHAAPGGKAPVGAGKPK